MSVRFQVLCLPSLEASVLATLADLYHELAKVCPNSVVPALKLQKALVALHGRKPVHNTCTDLECWAGNISAVIRAGMAAFRALKKDPVAKARCFSKAMRFEITVTVTVTVTVTSATVTATVKQ